MAGALKSFDCMQVAFCAGVARGFATCARERLRFAKLSIGRAAQGGARRSNFAPFWAALDCRWQIAASICRSEAVVRRHFAGRTLAAFKHEPRSHAEPPLRRGLRRALHDVSGSPAQSTAVPDLHLSW